MKTPLSAEEWLQEKKYLKTSKTQLVFMQQYSIYLLNFHLEQFAEECKGKAESCLCDYDLINVKEINQTLTDYKLKNNIK